MARPVVWRVRVKRATESWVDVLAHDGEQAEAEATAKWKKKIKREGYWEDIKDIDKKEGATIQTPADQQAIKWANEHPNDPRAAKIKKLHGVQ